ncbi:hypothetical protein ACT497_003005 [Salmonella enterica subsp. enterica serovar Glostrup]|nr:hypothetical protein [Salmonella enterica]EGI5342942.1 hypothetical protein [Salmonella enterica subsp. enterica serovar Sandiego]EHL4598378.1 hypothetical protein [Salmonella enterica subsp. enterica serovar Glostrup]EEG7823934.1 hypothetical protein [Salmonella enterica]EGK5852985.1 hypothetical protein [Salmonella enterica]
MIRDLPDAVRHMEIISADLAALAITGLLAAGTVNQAIQGNYFNQDNGTDGQDAQMYKTAIINAVRNSSLQAYSITVERQNATIVISSRELLIDDPVTDVEVFSTDLWSWFDKPSRHSIDNDPLAELNNYKAEFVSLQEVFNIFKSKYPHMTANQIAEWMVRKLCHENKPQVYTQGIAGKLYECGNDYYGDDNPFLLDLLERVINDGEEAFYRKKATIEPPLDFEDDIPF